MQKRPARARKDRPLLCDTHQKPPHNNTCLPLHTGRTPLLPDLEGQGVALSMSAVRFGYFYGGDGESLMRTDLRNAAGFVRDKGACVTNFMLPIKVREAGPVVVHVQS